MNTTPASLLERLRHPQAEEAWVRFVHLYTPLIYGWARRAGLSPHDAADLVQGVLTTLVRKMPEFSYDRDKSFRAWLRTVTLNAWRQENRKGALPLAGRDGGGLANATAQEDDRSFEEADYRRHLVGRALDLMQSEFQPATWQACWSSIVDGRPASEIAQELDISVNAVYLAKSRVLRRLRQELQGLLD